MPTVAPTVAPVIAILTDFGLSDPYVGILKAVILGIAPHVPILDLTHGVPPQDVLTGALHLDAAWRYVPEGSVFVCVVDPGVGSARRAVAARGAGRVWIGPDNGLLSLLPLDDARTIDPRHGLPGPASSTFHGRDLFAPAAARLAAGAIRWEEIGPQVEVSTLRALPALHPPPPHPDGSRDGEILLFDTYGNATTNLPGAAPGEALPGALIVACQGGHRALPICRTYRDAPDGAPLALTGSTGRLEIAVRDGDARAALGLQRGGQVRYQPRSPTNPRTPGAG